MIKMNSFVNRSSLELMVGMENLLNSFADYIAQEKKLNKDQLNLIKEQVKNTLKSQPILYGKKLPDNQNRCTHIYVKSSKEDKRCIHRACEGSTLCKTHKKSMERKNHRCKYVASTGKICNGKACPDVDYCKSHIKIMEKRQNLSL